MPSNPDFATDYISFEDDDEFSSEDVRVRKQLTFIGASAVSLLCYDKESEVANILQTDPKYKLIKENDIISDIWSLSSITGEPNPSEDYAAPLIAWSVRLQVLYIGFRGSHCAKDILTNIDVRQPSAEDLASRFHAGFLHRARFYSELIRRLAHKYNIVVCGHSLGGAMATIAAYLTMAGDNDIYSVANVWAEETPTTNTDSATDAPVKISTITFGAPSMMVVEPAGTTAALPRSLMQNFHHLVNRDDIVPFIVNSGIRTANKILTNARNLLKVAPIWPEAQWVFNVLARVFEIWTRNNCPFGHYGRLYLLDTVGGDGSKKRCHSITTSRQIPETPAVELRFHSMAHYKLCLGQTLANRTRFSDMNFATVMTSTQFYQDCLPFPAAVEDCEGTVYPDKIVLSATIKVPLIQFFTKNLVFKIGNQKHYVSDKEWIESSPGSNQGTLKMTYQAPPDATGETLIETAAAIRQTLRLQDSFGRALPIKVLKMDSPVMSRASLKPTDECIRDAMIMGLADQISMIQRLKREGGDRKDSKILSRNAKTVAALVDSLVVNASPMLIKTNFADASKSVEYLWQSLARSKSSTTTEGRKITDKVPPAHLNELQGLLDEIIRKFDMRKSDNPKTAKKEWAEMQTLSEVHLTLQYDILTQSLQDFSQEVYDRDTGSGSEDRIEKVIKQSNRILLVMRFCHAIILTQLETRLELCVELEPETPLMLLAVASGVFSSAQTYSLTMPAGLPGLFLPTVCYLAYGICVNLVIYAPKLVGYFTTKRYQLQGGFEATLEFSQRVLKVKALESSIPECTITDIWNIYNTKGDEHESDVKIECQKLLNSKLEGLADKPPKGYRYVATLAWVEWLFAVGKVGELRTLISDRLYIGVEGPTEAGKSQLLTTLTAAPETAFAAGQGAKFRTTEIQIYTPPNLTAVFCDCPGSDDRNPRIGELPGLFRGLMNIIIFVIPFDGIRSMRTETVYKDIVQFITQSKEPRAFRILMNKIDQMDYDDTVEDLADKVIEHKKAVIEQINRIGNFSADHRIRTLLSLDGTIVRSYESLEDIVQPFSTWAQMSRTGSRALSDCPAGTRRRVKNLDDHQNMYHLAERGVLWDIESLRQWLRSLAPNSVPDSSRILQDS
ncbi:hypothetical protein TWF281_004737 [Arthrobotrys megalospora]